MIAETMLVLIIQGSVVPVQQPIDGMTACKTALYRSVIEAKTATSGYCIDKYGKVVRPEDLNY